MLAFPRDPESTSSLDGDDATAPNPAVPPIYDDCSTHFPTVKLLESRVTSTSAKRGVRANVAKSVIKYTLLAGLDDKCQSINRDAVE